MSVDDSHDPRPHPQTHPITFENVCRQFDGRPVLRGLDLRVRPGEIHALLGRNGSGKTTAMRILLGFLAPHAGRSTLLGVDSGALGADDRGRIGYVSEDHRLYWHLRAREVLAFEAATRPRFDRALAEQALQRCALDPRARVIRLSRGQRAQLALIVAVASRPEVLVCDDPGLGLDVVMRRSFLDVLIDLLAGQGISVLFSSHILSDVERIADRVSILHEGRLIVDATLDDLKRRVRKRFWKSFDGAAPPPHPAILRAEKRGDGYDLTLLDADEALESALGGRLSPPVPSSLDDLFLDLTRGETVRILPAPPSKEQAA
jgi:ABC-2 type transport system ATP-binding protein